MCLVASDRCCREGSGCVRWAHALHNPALHASSPAFGWLFLKACLLSCKKCTCAESRRKLGACLQGWCQAWSQQHIFCACNIPLCTMAVCAAQFASHSGMQLCQPGELMQTVGDVMRCRQQQNISSTCAAALFADFLRRASSASVSIVYVYLE